jgi:hypothetical protein
MIELIDRLRSVDRVFATEAADLIERLQAEVLEQCRINGMGAERELALMAKVEMLEKRLEINERTKYDGIDCRDATIRELERENAELRKDAERYRFMRKADQAMVLKLAHYAFDALDAAIDEAMK